MGKVDLTQIEQAIHVVRGQRVMLDSDLAQLCGVTTSALNQAVARNQGRFPEDFAYQRTRQEFADLISQNVIQCLGQALIPVVLMLACTTAVCAGDWQPQPGPLATRWARKVLPDRVHAEYPRPQRVRPAWRNLNGLWDYAMTPRDAATPQKFAGQILVPFPVESALSGVMRAVGNDQLVWYRRAFDVPPAWRGQRVLLHFAAVDWECTAWVNGREVGTHRGGYDPFAFDITDALRAGPSQQLLVRVWDPTDAGFQPRGKQVARPHGIWYTAVTGIWQTAWLEPVPADHISRLKLIPDVDHGALRATVVTSSTTTKGYVRLRILRARQGDTIVPLEGIEQTCEPGVEMTLPIPAPRLWSPDAPWLYELEVQLCDQNGRQLDKVESYCGLRKISVGPDNRGIPRLLLNNRPLFQLGTLDQGWWPDGLYTAPTDDALRYDIEVTRQLGFNMIRKHVKVEPERWYYWCDRLGIMVWQDMPSGDQYIAPDQPDVTRSPESAANFRREYEAVITSRFNHPCIVMWVPFNEGWGQFATPEIVARTRQLDATRLVNNASGWSDRGVGDVVDLHRYPGPGMPRPEKHRAAVLGEFGGLGLPLPGHLWAERDNWGYRTFNSREELAEAYQQRIEQLRPLIGEGLAAAVYTQTTDVEIEVNGIMTYDRAITKLAGSRDVNRRVHQPPPRRMIIVPTSRRRAQNWRYTTQSPSAEWFEMDFDDAAWSSGNGGFGTPGTPGAVVGTVWNSSDLWLRRTFELDGKPGCDLKLQIHHDEEAEVYLNGRLAARLQGYTTDYVLIPIDAAAGQALQDGRNVLAVHCRQTAGGQYVDVGLVELAPATPAE